MGAQMDNPFDGRRAPEPADEFDGGIYAEGWLVCTRPKRTAGGITLGSTLAEATTAAIAAEIARRCAVFEPLLKLSKLGLRSLETEWMKILDNRPNLSDEGFRRLKADPIVVKLLADIDAAKVAIAQAEAP